MILRSIKERDREKPADVIREIRAIELDGYDKFGNPITAPVLVQSGTTAAPRSPLGKNQDYAMKLLEALSETFGVDTEPGEPIWVPVGEWRDHCQDVGIDRRRWPEVSKALAERGLIEMNEHHARKC